MGVRDRLDRIAAWFGFGVDEDYYEEEEDMDRRYEEDEYANAARVKRQQPVILNLQNVDGDLSRRMVDFCSGMTYALDGNIQSVANRVFLLTPRDVEVSAEERKRIAERAFFNQL